MAEASYVASNLLNVYAPILNIPNLLEPTNTIRYVKVAADYFKSLISFPTNVGG